MRATRRPAPGLSAGPRVVLGREVARLEDYKSRLSAEEAVGAGLLGRRKVEGIWLYARDEEEIDQVAAESLARALELCHDWLLVAMRPLAGKVAKDLGSLTMEAARPLMRAHVRAGHLGALPALTSEYEPHLLLHDPRDLGEILELLEEGRRLLSTNGALDAGDLGEPATPRTTRAWRYVILSHLEWLGLGSSTNGPLKGWT